MIERGAVLIDWIYGLGWAQKFPRLVKFSKDLPRLKKGLDNKMQKFLQNHPNHVITPPELSEVGQMPPKSILDS
jgi:hypothetical protein